MNFCHAYRVNCFQEQSENWYVARLTIRECFWWLKIDQARDNRDMKLNPTLEKMQDQFYAIKKSKIFHQYHTNCLEKWVKNCFEGGPGIKRVPTKEIGLKIADLLILQSRYSNRAVTLIVQSPNAYQNYPYGFVLLKKSQARKLNIKMIL